MNCPKCQYENPDVAKYCIKCGNGLSAMGVQQTTAFKTEAVQPQSLCLVCKKPLAQGSLDKTCMKCKENQEVKTEREYMRAFVGDNAYYYLSNWDDLKKGKRSLNWSALCGPYWFAYRKMYGDAILIPILWVISFSIMNALHVLLGHAASLTILAFVVTRANKSYLNYTMKKISQLKSKYTNEIEFKQALTRAGGTSVSQAIAFFLLIFAICSIPYAINIEGKQRKEKAREAEYKAYSQNIKIAFQPEEEGLNNLNAILSEPNIDLATASQRIDGQVVPKYREIKSKIEAIKPPEIAAIKEHYSVVLTAVNAKHNALLKMIQASNAGNGDEFKLALSEFNMANSKLTEFNERMKAATK